MVVNLLPLSTSPPLGSNCFRRLRGDVEGELFPNALEVSAVQQGEVDAWETLSRRSESGARVDLVDVLRAALDLRWSDQGASLRESSLRNDCLDTSSPGRTKVASSYEVPDYCGRVDGEGAAGVKKRGISSRENRIESKLLTTTSAESAQPRFAR
jgi:hypothetical protein